MVTDDLFAALVFLLLLWVGVYIVVVVPLIFLPRPTQWLGGGMGCGGLTFLFEAQSWLPEPWC